MWLKYGVKNLSELPVVLTPALVLIFIVPVSIISLLKWEQPVLCRCLTWTWGDVALLIILCWAQAGLASVPGLGVTAGPLPAPDSSATVPAALRPGPPGRPAAVHHVARDPPQAKRLACRATREKTCENSCRLCFSLEKTFSKQEEKLWYYIKNTKQCLFFIRGSNVHFYSEES